MNFPVAYPVAHIIHIEIIKLLLCFIGSCSKCDDIGGFHWVVLLFASTPNFVEVLWAQNLKFQYKLKIYF